MSRREAPPETIATYPSEKTGLHPRNRHRERYDFDQLTQANAELAGFVKTNAYGEASIDFANPRAVKALNRALLVRHYNILEWDIPARYLCPPIPGRADYLHHIADLLGAANGGTIPQGASIRALDIGVGANIIYPLIGYREYGWHFVGTDIDRVALKNASRILHANAGLEEAIELRLQSSPTAYFGGVIHPGEMFDLTLCNPPFHTSLDKARTSSRRKWQNLGKGTPSHQQPVLNFGGQGTELYCRGGEEAFVCSMIADSQRFAASCLWFTTLVSKATTLPAVYLALRGAGARKVHTIDMAQGQKKSRIVAWTFLNASQQRAWCGRW